MRAAARVHGYPPYTNAGAEWMLEPMLAALAARGHHVEVHLDRAWTSWPPSWDFNGVTVYTPDATPEAPRPDVFITHLDAHKPTLARARGLGIPLVYLCHNTRGDRVNMPAANPDLAVFNSAWMAAEYDWPGRSIIVHPPVLASQYQTTPGDRVTLVNLTKTKGGALFWELAERMPDTQFLGVQGSYGEQVTPEQVPPNVEILEHLDGRRMRDEVYARTRVLLVPSDYESWGRVATEAMCSGIPVIAHKAEGALGENLGRAAIWADREHPGEWERQLRRLNRPAVWEKASEACLKRYAELDPAAELDAWCAAVEALA